MVRKLHGPPGGQRGGLGPFIFIQFDNLSEDSPDGQTLQCTRCATGHRELHLPARF